MRNRVQWCNSVRSTRVEPVPKGYRGESGGKTRGASSDLPPTAHRTPGRRQRMRRSVQGPLVSMRWHFLSLTLIEWTAEWLRLRMTISCKTKSEIPWKQLEGHTSSSNGQWCLFQKLAVLQFWVTLLGKKTESGTANLLKVTIDFFWSNESEAKDLFRAVLTPWSIYSTSKLRLLFVLLVIKAFVANQVMTKRIENWLIISSCFLAFTK